MCVFVFLSLMIINHCFCFASLLRDSHTNTRAHAQRASHAHTPSFYAWDCSLSHIQRSIQFFFCLFSLDLLFLALENYSYFPTCISGFFFLVYILLLCVFVSHTLVAQTHMVVRVSMCLHQCVSEWFHLSRERLNFCSGFILHFLLVSFPTNSPASRLCIYLQLFCYLTH